jgi:hypothetical protein
MGEWFDQHLEWVWLATIVIFLVLMWIVAGPTPRWP